ncbi:hypothetical protein FOXB_04974 [Fusarium oxysporum f. sp. conglutinans Fo5176]|uniref:Uncharacterized protein n=1 Tax=Fusarium oxysporum (strain Fo5176) TaxID=660025 RepID=F9FEZ6_FUSOF|nr:hypothetical protein FOXB_04974 [Fusarium oxysporum f. sp. conglutinans Fo5176]
MKSNPLTENTTLRRPGQRDTLLTMSRKDLSLFIKAKLKGIIGHEGESPILYAGIIAYTAYKRY